VVYFEKCCFNKRAPLTLSPRFLSQKRRHLHIGKKGAALMVADKRITKYAYC